MKKIKFLIIVITLLFACIFIKNKTIEASETTKKIYQVKIYVEKVGANKNFSNRLDASYLTYSEEVEDGYKYARAEILAKGYTADEDYNLKSIIARPSLSESNNYVEITEELGGYTIIEDTDIYIQCQSEKNTYEVLIYSEYSDDGNYSSELEELTFSEIVLEGYGYANQEIRDKSKIAGKTGYIVKEILIKDDLYNGGFLDITEKIGYEITSDTIIYVRYRSEYVNIKFKSNLDDVEITDLNQQKVGTKIDFDFPEVENYVFYGLYTDENYKYEVDIDNGYYVNKDITLYVKYVKIKEKTINFIKSNKAILSLSQITSIYKTTLISGIICENKYDNYVGNGSNIGTYQIYFNLFVDDKEFIDSLEITVYSGLLCNYIYDNIVVIDNSFSYTKDYLVSDLQLLNILPKTEIYVDIDGEYYDKTTNKPIENPTIGDYETIIQYRTTDSEGTKEMLIKVVSSVQSDLIVEAPSDTSTIEYIIIGIIIFLLVIILFKCLKRLLKGIL